MKQRCPDRGFRCVPCSALCLPALYKLYKAGISVENSTSDSGSAAQDLIHAVEIIIAWIGKGNKCFQLRILLNT